MSTRFAYRARQRTVMTLVAVLVTITIWSNNPFLLWGEEIALFAIAGWACLRGPFDLSGLHAIPLISALIGSWGFVQLALGITVYRWATVNAALQNLALAAVSFAAYRAFRTPSARAALLRGFVRFSLILSVVSVLCYWTSPGHILWIFPSHYPDNWGPFPNRNNFAQFLELGFPITLSQLINRNPHWTAAIPCAVILGAGLASSSRAGAILLLAEAVCALLLLHWNSRNPASRGRWRATLATLALASAGFASLAGAGVLVHRFAEPDPFGLRRELFSTAIAMIRAPPLEHLWTGYGLGTFAVVYPQFAEFDSGARVEHAHNDWLEWTAEGGVFYAALWAALAAWAIRPAIRSVWGLGIIAVFLHALVDYPFARLGISMWVFLFLSILAREPQARLYGLELEKSPAREPLCIRGNR